MFSQEVCVLRGSSTVAGRSRRCDGANSFCSRRFSICSNKMRSWAACWSSSTSPRSDSRITYSFPITPSNRSGTWSNGTGPELDRRQGKWLGVVAAAAEGRAGALGFTRWSGGGQGWPLECLLIRRGSHGLLLLEPHGPANPILKVGCAVRGPAAGICGFSSAGKFGSASCFSGAFAVGGDTIALFVSIPRWL